MDKAHQPIKKVREAYASRTFITLNFESIAS